VSSDRRTIQLPQCSGVRTRKAYLKLLSRVDPDARDGFGFEGALLRPGARVSAEQLRPSADYPEIPVILEYSVAAASGIKGNRRAPALYVLWRWKPEIQQWYEVGRACSHSWEWAIDLRPLAIRALAEARDTAETVGVSTNLNEIAEMIEAFVENQLSFLLPPDKPRLLAILHDQFAARFSR
jgi:hypothetical protein